MAAASGNARPADEDPQLVPKPGFSRIPPAEALPGYDPSDSPLSPGGREGAEEPTFADSSLIGLTEAPEIARRTRVMVRVRRKGWIERRSQARDRFRTISLNRGASQARLLAGLDRRGILQRSKKNAVRPRFNMRGGRL